MQRPGGAQGFQARQRPGRNLAGESGWTENVQGDPGTQDIEPASGTQSVHRPGGDRGVGEEED